MKAKAKEQRSFVVRVEYTVSGTVLVEASSPEEARELAPDVLECPGTCEITDHEVISVREEKPW